VSNLHDDLDELWNQGFEKCMRVVFSVIEKAITDFDVPLNSSKIRKDNGAKKTMNIIYARESLLWIRSDILKAVDEGKYLQKVKKEDGK
jgi:hypothetical protein